jgi:hypothetical protein
MLSLVAGFSPVCSHALCTLSRVYKYPLSVGVVQWVWWCTLQSIDFCMCLLSLHDACACACRHGCVLGVLRCWSEPQGCRADHGVRQLNVACLADLTVMYVQPAQAAAAAAAESMCNEGDTLKGPA